VEHQKFDIFCTVRAFIVTGRELVTLLHAVCGGLTSMPVRQDVEFLKSLVTDCMADIRFPSGAEILLFLTAPRPALGLTHPVFCSGLNARCLKLQLQSVMLYIIVIKRAPRVCEGI
jgi:hypothetical protein